MPQPLLHLGDRRAVHFHDARKRVAQPVHLRGTQARHVDVSDR